MWMCVRCPAMVRTDSEGGYGHSMIRVSSRSSAASASGVGGPSAMARLLARGGVVMVVRWW